jgi:GNAT superfamily N-acetyltransferase
MSEKLAGDAVIRRLSSADREAFRAHLLRLDLESRHDRFLGGASDEFLERYADHCFAPGDMIFGAFVDGELRGAGELRPLSASDDFSRGESCHAEAAFSVESGRRRRGLGARLFERLMRAAEASKIIEIDFTCGADNKAMQSLARKFDAELRFQADHVTGRLRASRLTGRKLRSAPSVLAPGSLAGATSRNGPIEPA